MPKRSSTTVSIVPFPAHFLNLDRPIVARFRPKGISVYVPPACHIPAFVLHFCLMQTPHRWRLGQISPVVWQIGQGTVVFFVLLLTIWLVTQQANAPELILFLLLLITAVNFSLPPEQGGSGFVPVVAVSSLLVVGVETAVPLLTLSFLVAELARPLWNPLWDTPRALQSTWAERLAHATIHLLALLAAQAAYAQADGQTPLSPLPILRTQDWRSYAALGLGYGLTHLLLAAGVWVGWKRPFRLYLLDHAPTLTITSLLAQPFAILGALTFVSNGMPVFVVFSLGVMAFSIVNWLSWQRRLVSRQQVEQFARLNQVNLALRETLDLAPVLQRTLQEVDTLAPADQIVIWLLQPEGEWTAYANGAAPYPPLPHSHPDALTEWVATKQRLLNLHRGNLHYAALHQLPLPTPPPVAWVGIPLQSAQSLIGVLTLQRYASNRVENRPFNRWTCEVLLAVAGQISAAIHNARLYGETLRLYNLTDEALARRLEQLQALLNSVQEGVLLIDTAGRLALVNPVAAAWLPTTAVTIGTLMTETAVSHLDYTPAEWHTLLQQLAHGDAPATDQHTYALTRPDILGGTRHFFSRTGTAVHDRHGHIVGWLLVLRDVTEERELAEQRVDVTRMIVHDLRNPITTLISALHLVENRLAETPPHLPVIRDLVQDAIQGSSDMLDMVDSLMDITRLETGRLKPDAEAMRLPQLVAQQIKRLTPLALQRTISLTLQSDDDLPPVWADEEMIRRVLVNLLDNALKFTPSEGQIIVTLTPSSPATPGNPLGVCCAISDTGPGIPAEFKERVFERFMRTNPGGAQVRGTGLGLTFCQMAITAHNGRIWVEDTETGGSRFVFTLPGVPYF